METTKGELISRKNFHFKLYELRKKYDRLIKKYGQGTFNCC